MLAGVGERSPREESAPPPMDKARGNDFEIRVLRAALVPSTATAPLSSGSGCPTSKARANVKTHAFAIPGIMSVRHPVPHLSLS